VKRLIASLLISCLLAQPCAAALASFTTPVSPLPVKVTREDGDANTFEQAAVAAPLIRFLKPFLVRKTASAKEVSLYRDLQSPTNNPSSAGKSGSGETQERARAPQRPSPLQEPIPPQWKKHLHNLGAHVLKTKQNFRRSWNMLRDVPKMLKGDMQVADFTAKHDNEIQKCRGLLLLSTFIALLSPFVGLRLYDAAELGYQAQGTLATMIIMSLLLVVFLGDYLLSIRIDSRMAMMGIELERDVTLYLTENLPPNGEIKNPSEYANHIFSDPSYLSVKNIDLRVRWPDLIFQGFFSAGLLWWLDWKMAAIALSATLLVAYYSTRYARVMNAMARAIRDAAAVSKSDLEKAFQVDAKYQTMAGKLRSALIRRFNQSRNQLTTLQVKKAQLSARNAAVLEVFSDIGMLVLVQLIGAWGLYLSHAHVIGQAIASVSGHPTIGKILAESALAILLKEAVVDTFTLRSDLAEAIGGADFILKHWPSAKKPATPPLRDPPQSGPPPAASGGAAESSGSPFPSEPQGPPVATRNKLSRNLTQSA
jgi:hypothetical protein